MSSLHSHAAEPAAPPRRSKPTKTVEHNGSGGMTVQPPAPPRTSQSNHVVSKSKPVVAPSPSKPIAHFNKAVEHRFKENLMPVVAPTGMSILNTDKMFKEEPLNYSDVPSCIDRIQSYICDFLISVWASGKVQLYVNHALNEKLYKSAESEMYIVSNEFQKYVKVHVFLARRQITLTNMHYEKDWVHKDERNTTMVEWPVVGSVVQKQRFCLNCNKVIRIS